jgi:SAM-dependent methyltransferase
MERTELQSQAPCPICGGAPSAGALQLYDDRFGYPGHFDLMKCTGCQHRWIDWSPDEATLARLYTEYYPRSTRQTDDFDPLRARGPVVGWWQGQRSSASFWVPENVRILDIGCGFGESLGYHRSRGCAAFGVEADHNIARVAEHFGFDVHVGLFDPRLYEEGSFDYVTMDQVIEHTTDPLRTLEGIKRLLRPGGRLILSTPNAQSTAAHIFGHRWIHWHAPYHLQFFTPSSIHIAAAKCDLEIEHLATITSSEWLQYQWVHLATRPRLGRKSPFWSPSAHRTFLDRAKITLLSGLHRLGGNHLLTRLFDALGSGDNYVVSLIRPI